MHRLRSRFRPVSVVASGLMLLMASRAVAQLQQGTVNDVWPPSKYVISGATLEPTSQPSPVVQSLIDQLSGPIASRDDATNSLVAMDNSTADQLRGALSQRLSPDAADRVRSVITRMDQRSHIDPSVVTLHANKQPVREVLQDFARQINADIVVAPYVMNQAQTGTISVDLDHASFWEALAQIEKAMGVRASINYNQLILNSAMPGSISEWNNPVPTAIAGQFRIRPYQGIVTRRIEYGQERKPGTIELQLQVNYEPKTSPVNGFVAFSKIAMIDDHDNAFSPTGFMTPTMMSAGPRGEIAIPVRFPEIVGMGTRLKSLKGTLTAAVQTASKVVEFNDLPNAGQTRDLGGGASLQIQSVNVDKDYTNIEIGLTAPALTPSLNRLANDPEHAFETFDASGIRLVTISIERKAQVKAPNLVWDVRMPRFTGDPKILRVEIATDSQPVTLPFELDNVALPVPPVPATAP